MISVKKILIKYFEISNRIYLISNLVKNGKQSEKTGQMRITVAELNFIN